MTTEYSNNVRVEYPDSLSEEGRVSGVLAPEWIALNADPLCDFGVSRTFDRHNGVYYAPINHKIWSIRVEDQMVRVAMRSEAEGLALIGNKLALFKVFSMFYYEWLC